MKNKNVVLTSPLAGACGQARTSLFPSPLAGEGAQRAGEGYIKENNLIISPSSVCSDSVRQTTSPAEGGSHTANSGFTLIELLVVVLIIGILAAVAVPQYQKAVEKSRMVQEIVTVRALYNALERYRLANGEYPPLPASDQHYNIDVSYFNDLLDIDLPDIGTLTYFRDMSISFSSSHIGANWAIGGGYGNGKIICSSHPTYSTYEKYKNLCLTLCTDKTWRTWPHGEYCIL